MAVGLPVVPLSWDPQIVWIFGPHIQLGTMVGREKGNLMTGSWTASSSSLMSHCPLNCFFTLSSSMSSTGVFNSCSRSASLWRNWLLLSDHTGSRYLELYQYQSSIFFLYLISLTLSLMFYILTSRPCLRDRSCRPKTACMFIIPPSSPAVFAASYHSPCMLSVGWRKCNC